MSKMQELISENIALKEKITELNAEILELKIENVVDIEPISFSRYLIDLYKENGGEYYLDMLCELSDYIQTYCDHHQFDESEDEENDD
jgi:hypothetical protein